MPFTRSHAVRRVLANLALGTAALLLTSACSPAPMPISQSRKDPSSPLAPEGMSPMVAAASMPLPAQETGGHEHHDHGHGDHAGHAGATGHDEHGVAASPDGGAEGTTYVCPMHPEVTSTTPGSLCPKCNMKLVPKN